jgi:virginiamycin A acetyltransferase
MSDFLQTVRGQWLKLRLMALRRRQHDSVALRRLFADRYDIDVGGQSYGCFDIWRMPGPMRVGRYCSIASTVRSALINHPPEAITTHPILFERKFGVVDRDIDHPVPLVIEDDVWIGHNAMILPGCKRIGRGAIIGAGAIVTHDVARYMIVAGNPARTLRARFTPELATAIEATRWWLCEPAELRAIAATHPALLFHPGVQALTAWPQS